MQATKIDEKQLLSFIIKERVYAIKDKRYQGELVISEIIKLLNMTDKNLIDLEKQCILTRCVGNIFGTNKKLIKENEKNLILMQKLSLDLLNNMIDSNLVHTSLIKQVVKELNDITSDNFEIMKMLRQTIINLGELSKQVGTLEHKLNLQEMIKKIEYGSYDKEEFIYTILNILSDLDPGSIVDETHINLLKTVINKNIIEYNYNQPLRVYLMKISRMENLMANKIFSNLEIVDDNPVVKSIADTLDFATFHNDLQKKFQFSVGRLKEIATNIDINENLTINELLNFLIEAMVIKYKNQNELVYSEEIIKEDIFDYKEHIIKLLLKNYDQITKKYNFYNYQINEIMRADFNYKNFLKEIKFDAFNELVDLDEEDILIFLAVILGDIDTFKVLPNLSVKKNVRHNITLYTPVMYASKYGKLEMVKYLMTRNANINYVSFKDNKNSIALAIENNHIEIVRLLFRSGANAFNKNILTIGYKNNAIDVIRMVEKYYFENIIFGRIHIKDIIKSFVEKIALNRPYEFYNDGYNKKKKKAILAVKYLTNNRVSVADVVAFIDLSGFKNAKEGLLFTTSGIYIKYMRGKNFVKIFQPYFVIDKIRFHNYVIVIDNILSSKNSCFTISKHYYLTAPYINNQELFKCLYTINDITNRPVIK